MPSDAEERPENEQTPLDAAAPAAPDDSPLEAEAAETVSGPAALPAEPAALGAESDELPDGAVEPDATTAEEQAAEESGEATVNIGVLEAMLFSTHHPLTGGQLAELLDAPSTKPVRKAIRQLNEQYEHGGRCFRIEQVAGGFQMLTLPMYGEALQALHHREADSRLTKSALETLAIVAYKQPILRADVEAIRGVASGETIRSLMEKHLVKIAGRAELPGRPILYGTTRRFLEVFGLNSLRDLPQAENRAKAAVPALPPEVQQNLAEEPAPAGEEDLEAADSAAKSFREVNEGESAQIAEAHAADEPQAGDANLPGSEGDDLNIAPADQEAAADAENGDEPEQAAGDELAGGIEETEADQSPADDDSAPRGQ